MSLLSGVRATSSTLSPGFSFSRFKAIPFTLLPTSTKAKVNRSKRLGGNNQNDILFNHGNAMSGAPIRIGTNQFPNPPIIAGITIKKIIKKA